MRINTFFYKKKIFIFFLFIFSIIINQYYGFRGVFPIDSFIIYESGYNVLFGNYPFKDYWSITGPLLDYVQSIFFLILGVNWFSYVLHASIINMVLTLSTFYFFVKINLNINYAFIYSLGVSILAYPSAGTPFMDHHAVIFSVIALYSLILAIKLEKKLFWFFTSLFLTFSFFSKQIPSAYLLILFSIFIFYYFFFIKSESKKIYLLYLFYGFLFPSIIVIIIFFVNEIPVKNFFTQYLFYPLSLGDIRINKLNINFDNLIGQFKFIYLSLIPFFISLIFLLQKNNKTQNQKKEIIFSLLFLISIFVFIYCQMLTKNQILIFFLIPICAAYSHSFTNFYLKKNYIIYFILLIFIFSTFKYHFRFNENKKFMELVNADFSLSIDASKIDQSLSGLKWITPTYLNDPLKEINLLINTKEILSKNNNRKIIITNYQFFSSIVDNVYASPNKWYDYLSVPPKNSKFYTEYENFFISQIKNKKIEYVYAIGKSKENFILGMFKDNKCLESKIMNEILTEFNISKCKL